MKKIAAMLILMLPAFSSAAVFNGNRHGFVAGIGIGFAPHISWKSTSDGLPYVTGESGFAAHWVLGYCFGQKDMVVYEGNHTWYTSSDVYRGANRQVSLLQALWGVSWYHYYGRAGRSVFTTLGAGIYLNSEAWSVASRGGTALMLGGGYEFARHFQVGLYYTFGEEMEFNIFGSSRDVRKAHHLSLLVTAMGY